MGLSFFYVGGFAAVLAIVAILQMVKVREDGEVVPQRTWKWVVFFAAAWPIVAGLTVLAWALTPFIKTKAMGVHKEDYAFTIEVHGETWDCYHFMKEGKRGTMAFTQRDGKFVIGLMQESHLTKDQAREALEKNCKMEDN